LELKSLVKRLAMFVISKDGLSREGIEEIDNALGRGWENG
jgi:hypothetical protein